LDFFFSRVGGRNLGLLRLVSVIYLAVRSRHVALAREVAEEIWEYKDEIRDRVDRLDFFPLHRHDALDLVELGNCFVIELLTHGLHLRR